MHGALRQPCPPVYGCQADDSQFTESLDAPKYSAASLDRSGSRFAEKSKARARSISHRSNYFRHVLDGIKTEMILVDGLIDRDSVGHVRVMRKERKDGTEPNMKSQNRFHMQAALIYIPCG